MGTLSRFVTTGFEIMNELYTAVGAGVLGMLVLVQHGFQTHQTVKTLSVIAITAASLAFGFSRDKPKILPSKRKVVVITGCDSGLGFSLAQHAAECGFTVIATFLNLDSKGSKEIRRIFGGAIIQIHLDVMDSVSIKNAVFAMEHYFNQHPDCRLHALVNNAGVMVFGEFEWQTEKLVRSQIEVNLIGTFKITSALCHLLRKHRGRIVTVSSHCALANLPGLSVYGATKAALSSWSDGLRVEMGKYGVQVVTFIPGSFATQSNIMGRQLQNVQEMHDNFTEEQHEFYRDYFKRYNVYLSFLTPASDPYKIDDSDLYKKFEGALVDAYPNAVYKHEPLRYKLYHLLFAYSPVVLRDYFVLKFMQMPEFKANNLKEEEEEEELNVYQYD